MKWTPALSGLILSVVFATFPFAVPAATIVPVTSSDELTAALQNVAEGDIIEISAGTFQAPAAGFLVQNKAVSFTLRAADQANVTLSGGGNGPVLLFTNTAPATQHTVLVERLVISDGFSSDPQIGGGVTLIQSAATFVECSFFRNTSTGALTGGGAVFMRDGAVAHFFESVFSDNTAIKEGAAIRLRNDCEASIHDCTFTNNRTDGSGHHESASGGAINVFDSALRITNSRFSGNAAGCFGGAIYVKGIYNDLPEYASEILISNSLFEGNIAQSDPGTQCGQPTIAGAVHLENDIFAKVFSSRFILNKAEMGGAFGNFRGHLEIEDSVFRGNRAFGTTSASGTGGALHTNSSDVADASTDDGAINRPSAQVLVHRSFFQGRYGTTGKAANKGACVYARGDSNRSYGVGVPQDGSLDQNRATVKFLDSVFVDCDSGFSEDGNGGAMAINHTALTLSNCLVLGNDAEGTTGNGGAARLTVESTAQITDSWFQENTGGIRAAVFMVSGSDLAVDQCTFVENTLSSGAKGSVVWSTPANATQNFPAMDVNGSVDNSVFVLNNGWDIAETDNAAGPINAVTYKANRFFTDPADGPVFNSTLSPLGRTVSELNAFVAVRNGGIGNTDKAPDDDNIVLVTSPALGAISAAPPVLFHTAAAGETVVPTEAFLAWAWNGGTATLDGSALHGSSGIGFGPAGSGIHTLEVDGGPGPVTALIDDAAVPAVDFEALPEHINSGEISDLGWNVWSGQWVDVVIDRGVVIQSPAAVGLQPVMPGSTTVYRVHAITHEGGTVASATVHVDEELPELLFVDGFESGGTGRWSAAIGD
ncbi:MAG: right-handed parallel beta-helix repeat-containing protein [Acidobacteriota bacterium]